jgi:hypothetical protein
MGLGQNCQNCQNCQRGVPKKKKNGGLKSHDKKNMAIIPKWKFLKVSGSLIYVSYQHHILGRFSMTVLNRRCRSGESKVSLHFCWFDHHFCWSKIPMFTWKKYHQIARFEILEIQGFKSHYYYYLVVVVVVLLIIIIITIIIIIYIYISHEFH